MAQLGGCSTYSTSPSRLLLLGETYVCRNVSCKVGPKPITLSQKERSVVWVIRKNPCSTRQTAGKARRTARQESSFRGVYQLHTCRLRRGLSPHLVLVCCFPSLENSLRRFGPLFLARCGEREKPPDADTIYTVLLETSSLPQHQHGRPI